MCPCIITPIFESMTLNYFLFSDTFCGENIYMSALPYSWSQVIGIWYSESKNFSYGKYVSQDLVITHHYTQVTAPIGYGTVIEVKCTCQEYYHFNHF